MHETTEIILLTVGKANAYRNHTYNKNLFNTPAVCAFFFFGYSFLFLRIAKKM